MKWFRAFMKDRNGTDHLQFAIMFLYWPISFAAQSLGSRILEYLSMVVIYIFVYRFFSKDLTRQRRYNARFIMLWNASLGRIPFLTIKTGTQRDAGSTGKKPSGKSNAYDKIKTAANAKASGNKKASGNAKTSGDNKTAEEKRVTGRSTATSIYEFFTCPACGQKLRVPSGKGNIIVNCTKCGEKFSAKT